MAKTLPAFDNPRTTGDLIAERFRKLHRPKPKGERADTVTIPGLDVGELRRMYGPEQGHLPHRFTATFRVPLGISPAHYGRLRDAAATKFVKVMDKKGYDLVSRYRIQVEPGMYPAYDVTSGTYLLGEREMLIRAHFVMRNPKVRRIELPPHLTQPMTVRQ